MTYQNPQQVAHEGKYEMKKKAYKVKLESDYYEALEETSEHLLIVWEDDDGSTKLKIENKKLRKEEDGEQW